MKACYLLFAAGLLLSSCAENVIVGRGSVSTETKHLPSTNFNRIEISAPVDANISVGGAHSLSFQGFSNLLPYLKTEVRDGTLRIFTDELTELETDKNIIANISLPSLTGLDLSGSSDAHITGAINVPDFALDASGSTSVDIADLHVSTFAADMSGSSELILTGGEIGRGSFDISGSGEIRAFGVRQRDTHLDLSGSADAEVNVSGQLNVEISGAGEVAYKGHPRITEDISGAGTITDAN